MKWTRAAIKQLGWVLCWLSFGVSAYAAVFEIIHRSEFRDVPDGACSIGMWGSVALLTIVPGNLGALAIFMINRSDRTHSRTFRMLYTALWLLWIGFAISGPLLAQRYQIHC
jgi:hypothetical protein